MRQMKDSGLEWIGEIPICWDIMPNKYLMKKLKRIQPVYNGEDIISLTINGVVKRDLENPSGKMPTSFDGYQVVYPNNLLMCLFDIDVTPRCVGLIRDYGLTSPAYSQYVLNDNANSSYYYWYYLNLDFNKELLHLAKNQRHSLNEEQFGAILTAVPPIEEQQKIADFLDKKCAEIDDLIDDIQVQIETLEQYKKSVITQAVTKGLNPDVELKDSGLEWLGEIPKSWEKHPIYFYFQAREHKNVFGEEDNLLSLSYGKIIRKDINTNGGLLPNNFNTYNIIEQGDIVLRLTDLQNDKRSLRVGLAKERGIITSAYVTLKAIKKLSTAYFYYLLHAYDVMKVLYNMGSGVRQGLNYSELSKLMLIEPPIEEQQKIADFLDKKCKEIDDCIDSKKEQIETLENYKKSVIYEYVTGKKEVF